MITKQQLEGLDPGIRRTVEWLNSHGFCTVDSGDGQAKYDDAGNPQDSCARPEPNVSILVTQPTMLLPEADRLARIMRSIGIGGRIDEGGISVQASYDPFDQSCVIDVVGLHDAILPADALSAHRP
jgi:hypothetical protein